MMAWTKVGSDLVFTSCIFNQYLIVEHMIGQHELNIRDAWRLMHPHIILECIPVSFISRLIIPVTWIQSNWHAFPDWDNHYQTQDLDDPIWSGLEYSFDINKIADDLWQQLADRVATYFDCINPLQTGEWFSNACMRLQLTYLLFKQPGIARESQRRMHERRKRGIHRHRPLVCIRYSTTNRWGTNTTELGEQATQLVPFMS